MAYESLPKIAPALFSSEQDLIEVYNKKTDTVGVINPSQISTPLPSGVLSVDNPLSSTLQPIEDKSGTASALSISTNRVGLASDPSVTTQSSSVIAANTTNANLVIAPNGTGALVASIPDGTATGGNARGANAVDLQMVRIAATQVSSGIYAAILGGNRNTSSGNVSTVGGGESNSIVGAYSFIGGGTSNSITAGSQITISGGQSNTASTNWSTISGGQSNTASTNTHATVVGGQSNTSSGQYSVSGGLSNTASGSRSIALGWQNSASNQNAIAMGYQNTASGLYGIVFGAVGTASGQFAVSLGYNSISAGRASVCIGGETNRANATNSIVMSGTQGLGYLLSQIVSSPNIFTAQGDCQSSTLNAFKSESLNSAATTVLSLDGTGTTNLIIPNGNNRMWNVQIDTIAVVTTITGTATGVVVGDAYRETKQLLFKRVGGTSSIVGTVDTTAVKNDTSMSTASLVVTAGASQEMALTFAAPTFSGGGSLTCRVVSKVELVEVAY